MSCAITSGYALDCKDVVGGIKNIFITELSNVQSVAENASGFVTAITMVSSSKFYKYALMPKGANSFTENIQSDPANGTVAYEPTVSVTFSKLKYETAYKLQQVIKNRCAVIVETKDGSYFLLGKEHGMEVSGGTGASGTAQNDFQGYTLEMNGMEKAMSPEINSSIIAGITVA